MKKAITLTLLVSVLALIAVGCEDDPKPAPVKPAPPVVRVPSDLPYFGTVIPIEDPKLAQAVEFIRLGRLRVYTSVTRVIGEPIWVYNDGQQKCALWRIGKARPVMIKMKFDSDGNALMRRCIPYRNLPVNNPQINPNSAELEIQYKKFMTDVQARKFTIDQIRDILGPEQQNYKLEDNNRMLLWQVRTGENKAFLQVQASAGEKTIIKIFVLNEMPAR